MALPNTLTKGDKVTISSSVPASDLSENEYLIRDNNVVGTVIGRISPTTVKVTFPASHESNVHSCPFFDRELTKEED